MKNVEEFIKKDIKGLPINISKQEQKWNDYIVYIVTFNKAGNFGTPIFVLEDENGGLRYCTNEEVYQLIYFYNKGEGEE